MSFPRLVLRFLQRFQVPAKQPIASGGDPVQIGWLLTV
jgi:hypothetical protein